MALPGNIVSTDPVVVNLLAPDSIGYKPFIVYEKGGVDLQDTTQGLNSYDWRAKLVGNKIVIERDPDKYYEFVTGVSNVSSIDLAFDQNMNPAVVYEVGTSAFLYWFDSIPQQYVTTEFTGLRSPRLSLDDKRQQFNNTSDIIFGYIKTNGDLAYRQQRDRYTIERVVSTGIPDHLILEKIGMAANNRFLFEITPEYLLPLCGVL